MVGANSKVGQGENADGDGVGAADGRRAGIRVDLLDLADRDLLLDFDAGPSEGTGDGEAASSLFDRFDRSRNIKIARQDAAILENVKPGRPPESPNDVLFVKPDGILAHLETSRKKWEAMGWRIDLEEIRKYPPGRKQFVIPSPGRRQSGQWVYDPVPLIPPKPLDVATASQAF